MDDPMQWKCVLDKLTPAERGNVMVAVPDARPLQGTLYRNWAVEVALLRHRVNDAVDYQQTELPAFAVFAAWLKNYDALRRYIRAALDRPEVESRELMGKMLLGLVQYGDARSLEIMVQEAPKTYSYRGPTIEFLGSVPNLDIFGRPKMQVLAELYGYRLYREAASPMEFRVFNTDPLPVLVERAVDAPKNPVWRRYEYVRKALSLLDLDMQRWPDDSYADALRAALQRAPQRGPALELLRALDGDRQLRALIETAQMALTKGH